MGSVTAAAAAPDLRGITVLVNSNSGPPFSHWDLLGYELFFELLQWVPSALLTTSRSVLQGQRKRQHRQR